MKLMLAVCKSHGIFATKNCLMYINMIYIYQACHYMTHIMFITYMYISFLHSCILSIHMYIIYIYICIYQAIQLFTTRICTIPPWLFLFFSEMYNESVSSWSMEAAPDAHQERHHAEESLKELEREILGSKHD